MSETQHTKPGRYPRGLETRQRIVETAIEMFASQGYGGTSTRDIAGAAGVNTPAIKYYFDSKLGLYNACVDRTIAIVLQHITPSMARCRALLAQDVPVGALIDALCALQDCMLDSFFSDDEGRIIWRILTWENAENEETNAKELIQERVGMLIFDIFAQGVKKLTPGPVDLIDAHLHAMAIMGLSMIFNFDQSGLTAIVGQGIARGDMLTRLKSVTDKQLRFALSGLANQSASQ